MATRSLLQSINDYLDADVVLEWRQEIGAGIVDQNKRVERARRRLQRQLANARPEDASLIQKAESYLNAHLADRVGAGEKPDHRPLQRARRDLVEEVRSTTRAAEQTPSGTGNIARPIPLTSRILIAIDDSKASEWAIDVGGGLAQSLDAHVMILHVVNSPGGEFPYADPDVTEQRRREGATLLERAQFALPQAVDSDQMLSEGDPAREIVSAARVWEADLIVVGTRGRGKFAQLLLGSTAEGVIRESSCPVLTVGREPERFVGQALQKVGKATLTQA